MGPPMWPWRCGLIARPVSGVEEWNVITNREEGKGKPPRLFPKTGYPEPALQQNTEERERDQGQIENGNPVLSGRSKGEHGALCAPTSCFHSV